MSDVRGAIIDVAYQAGLTIKGLEYSRSRREWTLHVGNLPSGFQREFLEGDKFELLGQISEIAETRRRRGFTGKNREIAKSMHIRPEAFDDPGFCLGCGEGKCKCEGI